MPLDKERIAVVCRFVFCQMFTASLPGKGTLDAENWYQNAITRNNKMLKVNYSASPI